MLLKSLKEVVVEEKVVVVEEKVVVVEEKVVILIGFGVVSVVVVKKERHEQIKEKLEDIEKKQDVIKNKFIFSH